MSWLASSSGLSWIHCSCHNPFATVPSKMSPDGTVAKECAWAISSTSTQTERTWPSTFCTSHTGPCFLFPGTTYTRPWAVPQDEGTSAPGCVHDIPVVGKFRLHVIRRIVNRDHELIRYFVHFLFLVFCLTVLATMAMPPCLSMKRASQIRKNWKIILFND